MGFVTGGVDSVHQQSPCMLCSHCAHVRRVYSPPPEDCNVCGSLRPRPCKRTAAGPCLRYSTHPAVRAGLSAVHRFPSLARGYSVQITYKSNGYTLILAITPPDPGYPLTTGLWGATYPIGGRGDFLIGDSIPLHTGYQPYSLDSGHDGAQCKLRPLDGYLR